MGNYLATWRYLDGSEGQEPFSDPEIAKSRVNRRIGLMGGLGVVTRLSDFKTIYRIWNLKEDTENVAA